MYWLKMVILHQFLPGGKVTSFTWFLLLRYSPSEILDTENYTQAMVYQLQDGFAQTWPTLESNGLSAFSVSKSIIMWLSDSYDHYFHY